MSGGGKRRVCGGEWGGRRGGRGGDRREGHNTLDSSLLHNRPTLPSSETEHVLSLQQQLQLWCRRKAVLQPPPPHASHETASPCSDRHRRRRHQQGSGPSPGLRRLARAALYPQRGTTPAPRLACPAFDCSGMTARTNTQEQRAESREQRVDGRARHVSYLVMS